MEMHCVCESAEICVCVFSDSNVCSELFNSGDIAIMAESAEKLWGLCLPRAVTECVRACVRVCVCVCVCVCVKERARERMEEGMMGEGTRSKDENR